MFKDHTVVHKNRFASGVYLVLYGSVNLLFDDKSKTPLFTLEDGGMIGDAMVIDEPELMTSV